MMEIPPPLPPPRYLADTSAGESGGSDLAWSWTDSRKATSDWRSTSSVSSRPSWYRRRFAGRRNDLNKQPELSYREFYLNTIKEIQAEANSNPEIKLDRNPKNEGYANSSETITASNRPIYDEPMPAQLGFQTNAQAYDRPLVQALDARNDTNYAARGYSTSTSSLYANHSLASRRLGQLKPLSLPISPLVPGFFEDSLNPWEEIRLKGLHTHDYSTQPDALAGQKRRASSPPRDSHLSGLPSLDSSPRTIWTRIHHNGSLEIGPVLTSQNIHENLKSSSFGNDPKISGLFMCECCPKKPKKFNSEEELQMHEQEKQYLCAYCRNSFKNKNEAERHQNSLHVRRHSWSCGVLSSYIEAFHSSPTRPDETDTCGYCGEDFPRSGSGSTIAIATQQDWEVRLSHLQEMHKFGECNHAKKFFRADQFRQHLKYIHAATRGKWMDVLENTCMKDEVLKPIASRHLTVPQSLETISGSDKKQLGLPNAPQETGDDTDAKTSFSKDSGYSSMVSKAHRPTPDSGEKKSETDKWESESVASIRSLVSMNTISSVNPTAAGGAAEELAEMLVKDDLICGLIIDGYKNFGLGRFERNLRRILKRFAFSLRREARNDLEKSAIRLIHNYRAYVIILIRKRLKLAEDRFAPSLDGLQKQKQSQLALERFLESLPGVEEVVADDEIQENGSGSDNDSDLSNGEQPYLPTLERVKLYLLSSIAYSELKQQLTEFVRASNITNPLESDDSPRIESNTGSDCVDKVKEERPAAEQYIVLDLSPCPKPEVNYLQFGSPSTRGVQFTWNAAFDMPQPKEVTQRLQKCNLDRVLEGGSHKATIEQNSLEAASKADYPRESVAYKRQPPTLVSKEVCLESWEPKRGRLEEAMLSLKPLITMSPQCVSRLSLTLQNWWARSTRKPVNKNRSRIEWTCACGHDLFADFNTQSPTTLNKHSAILKYTADRNSQSITSQTSASTLALPPTAHVQHSSSSDLWKQTPQTLSNQMLACSSQTPSVTSNNGLNLSFLELCVNTGPHLKSLAEIDVANISTDGALFRALKEQYLHLRGFRSKFWLLKPAAVSFVRFSLENRHKVGILQKPLALPPKSEVDAKKWIYDPCPLDGDIPIAEDLFLHYLQCSEGSSTLFWMQRFPRKLETSLLKSAAPATFGWGIHIDEGPDFAVLFKANFIVLLLSGVAAGLWTIFEHDFQGAFGFACWIIAVLNSLLMAYMFKWKQE